jgi:hypothetical protein
MTAARIKRASNFTLQRPWARVARAWPLSGALGGTMRRADFAEAYQEQVHNLAVKYEWREREWPVMAPNSALLTDAFHSALRGRAHRSDAYR